MTSQEILQQAIERSISHTEIVHCQIPASEQIETLIPKVIDGDWDYSAENDSEDGYKILDVYSTGDGCNQWRIQVTLAG